MRISGPRMTCSPHARLVTTRWDLRHSVLRDMTAFRMSYKAPYIPCESSEVSILRTVSSKQFRAYVPTQSNEDESFDDAGFRFSCHRLYPCW